MTSEERVRVVRALYDAFNQKDIDRLDAMVLHGTAVELRGFDARMGLREAFQNWATAFPDAKVEIVGIDARGDEVVAEIIARGTHRGPLVVPYQVVRPTHRKVELRLVERYQFDEVTQMITSGSSDFDADALYAQLGIERPLKVPRIDLEAEAHRDY